MPTAKPKPKEPTRKKLPPPQEWMSVRIFLSQTIQIDIRQKMIGGKAPMTISQFLWFVNEVTDLVCDVFYERLGMRMDK